MNPKEYEVLLQTKEKEHFILTSDDLYSRGDRTLLYGYTCDRSNWHVYLQDLEIYVVMYDGEELTRILPNSNYGFVPDKRLYPAQCDYEFCRLLSERGVDLPFTTFTTPESESMYYGRLYNKEDSK